MCAKSNEMVHMNVNTQDIQTRDRNVDNQSQLFLVLP